MNARKANKNKNTCSSNLKLVVIHCSILPKKTVAILKCLQFLKHFFASSEVKQKSDPERERRGQNGFVWTAWKVWPQVARAAAVPQVARVKHW